MKLTTLSYKLTKNLGNDESETFEAAAVIDEGEDVGEAANYLRNWVNWLLCKRAEYYKKPETLDKKYKEMAREFRYTEFVNGDLPDDFIEDKELCERELELTADAYLTKVEMLGELQRSEFKYLKRAIMEEFGF